MKVTKPDGASAHTREYVWGPGYVDEIICQMGSAGVPPAKLYYPQDANYNVVVVTDEDGAVVAQYAYKPYGGVCLSKKQPGHTRLRATRLGLLRFVRCRVG